MFQDLPTTKTAPVDIKKLDKVKHVMAVDDESDVWIASVSRKFYHTPGAGDVTTCLESPEVGAMAASAVALETAPLPRGILVQSYTQGVVRVTPEGISALHPIDNSGSRQIHALASSVESGEFVIIDDAGQIVIHDLEGDVLATHDPHVLMGLGFSKSQRTRLRINARWLVMANLNRLSILDRSDPDATPYTLPQSWYTDVHLSGDTLVFHDSSSYHELDLVTRERSPSVNLGHPFDVRVNVTAMDFESRVIAGEGERERGWHGFGAFDEDGYYGAHTLHDKLCKKRMSRISNIHEDLAGRLWIESMGDTSTRYLIFDGKGKPAKFKKQKA